MTFHKQGFTTLLFAAILCAFRATGATIDSLQTKQTAYQFLKTKYREAASAFGTKTITSKGHFKLHLVKSTPATHLFATPQNDFVLVAADDRLPEILGYGMGQKTHKGSTIPAALQTLVKSYNRFVNTDVTIRATPADGGKTVAPLLSFTRHQEAPYNAYCPYYKADDGTLSEQRCVVGCVATALEEVVSYHRRIVTLVDTLHGWSTPHYTIADILPGTTVDTRLIADNYNAPATYTAAQADAVARLSYMLGVAAHMNWAPTSSGSSAARPVEALKRAFGFGYVHYADSYKYRPDDWTAMIREELRQGRPVFYTGNTMALNGHAFVVDGLDSDGLFHINWGTNGDFDGFFRLDVLYANEPAYDQTPQGAQTGFFTNQQAILLHPDAISPALPDTLQRTGLELVVDSLVFDLPPEHGKNTPMRLWVRNTAAYPTTTSLEFFTNDAADLHPFEDGNYGALTCVSLLPGERRELPVDMYFKKGGEFLLRTSPDDVHIIDERPVRVPWGEPCNLEVEAPMLSFPEPSTLQVDERISNDAAAGRAGLTFYYEVFKGRDYLHGGVVHPQRCYALPGETMTHTVRFLHLEPGAEYTLYVRRGWSDICHTVHFYVPNATGITPKTSNASNEAATKTTYDVSGRRIRHPRQGLLYIENGKKTFNTQQYDLR